MRWKVTFTDASGKARSSQVESATEAVARERFMWLHPGATITEWRDFDPKRDGPQKVVTLPPPPPVGQKTVLQRSAPTTVHDGNPNAAAADRLAKEQAEQRAVTPEPPTPSPMPEPPEPLDSTAPVSETSAGR